MSGKAPLLHRVGDVGANLGRRPPRSRTVQIALGVAIAGLIFAFLIYTVASQWTELREQRLAFDPVWLIPGAVVIMCFYPVSALGWDLVLRLLGHRIPVRRAQMVWGQSLLGRYVPGSVLFVVGRVLLAEREGVPRRATLASFVYEIGLQFTAAALVGSYFFLTHPDLAVQPVRFVALLVVPGALVVFHPRVFGPLSTWALGRLGRAPLAATLPLRGVVGMLGYYAAMWALLGVGLFFVARAVVPLELEDIGAVISAQAIAFCAAVMSLVAPGGLGVRDGAFAWVVKVAVGGSLAVGAAIAIAARLAMTLAELAYVAIVTAIGRRHGLTLEGSPGSGPPPATGPTAERR